MSIYFFILTEKIVCYFRSSAVNRKGKTSFQISDIDPKLCTHLIYAFVGMDPKGDIRILNPSTDLPEGKNGFNLFNKLRDNDTKTLISIGGWGELSNNYSIVAEDPIKRKLFARNTLNFVKKWGFDGLDFDWEYPTLRGGKKNDRENFVLLLKEIKELFEAKGLLLSAALGANLSEESIHLAYNISGITKYLDWINLMTYDYYDSERTSLNAPLYGLSKDDKRNIVSKYLLYFLKYIVLKLLT